MLGKLDSHMQKKETRLLFVSIYKNLLKVDQRLKHKTWSNNYIEENIVLNLWTLVLGFYEFDPKGKEIKCKNT